MLKYITPRIRFQGFKSWWKSIKLTDLGIFVGGTAIESEFNPEGKYKVISIGSYSEESKYKDQGIRAIYSKKTEKRILEKDDLTMILNDKTSTGKIIGRVLLIDEDNSYVYNQRTQRICLNKNKYVPDFIFQLLNADINRNKIVRSAQGNTQIYVNWSDISNLDYLIPESIEEQQAIGSLFRTLDDLLASYKDNLVNYQSLKATMLSKMFPKAGQTVPEIRLDGFKGEWRIIKLGDVLSELKSGLSRELSNDDIGLPVIRANNISDGNLNLDRDIKYWFKDDPKGANTANYFVRENDILVNFINSETKMGTAAIVLREPDRETIYTTNILKLTVKEDYYPYFVYLMTFVQSYQNYIKAITKPAVNQASFTTVDFKKYDFLCPAFQEQQAISAYFLNLDNLINSHQEKITQIETLKKKLLQDMFI